MNKEIIQKNKKNVIFIGQSFLKEQDKFIKDENNNIYVYEKNIYKKIDKKNFIKLFLNNFVLKYNINDVWTTTYINNLWAFIESVDSIKTVKIDDYDNFLCFKNGILNIETREFIPHSNKFYFTSIIDVEYKEKAGEAKYFMKFIREIFNNDQDTTDNILMMCGYLLSTSIRAEKMFVFDGKPSSGKSTLIKAIEMFFTRSQISAVSLEQIANNDFEKADLLKSKINLSAEEKKSYLDAEELKKIITGDLISVREIYGKPVTTTIRAKLLLACNGMTKFKDTSGAMTRRLLIFKFKNEYKTQEERNEILNYQEKNIYIKDIDLLDKIKKEKSEMLNIFIEALLTLKTRKWKFINSKQSIETIKEYDRDNDTIREFIEDNYKEDKNSEMTINEIYRHYREWYQENVSQGKLKLRINEFGKRIKEIMRIKPMKRKRDYYNPITEKNERHILYHISLLN